jgi:ferric-dicitrate binding protein FerR (iron transport regulator)
MTSRNSSPDILRELGSCPIPAEHEEVVSERRSRLVSHIAREIRETATERRQRRQRRFALVLAAAAAIALLLTGVARRNPATSAGSVVASVHASGPGVVVVRGAESLVAPPDGDQPLAPGDAVSTTAETHAALRLASGAEIQVGSGTRVTLAEIAESERIELGVGEVSVDVPPLGPNRHFSVTTPNARVVVHGTAFSVHVDKHADGTTVTEVGVTRGKVGVSTGGDEILLLPGDHWSSDTRRAAATPSPAEPPPSRSATARRGATKPPPEKPAATIDPSALALQNKLFASARAASRRGDDRAALASLDQLINRYPQSPLVPEARVERFRALKRLGQDDAAAREARRYLLEQGDGAARDEARDVALDPK